MPDPAATLSDIARVLRGGGPLVIACRTSDDATPRWMDPEIYHIRSADEIATLLRAASFAHINHHPGDTSNHATHLFVARLDA